MTRRPPKVRRHFGNHPVALSYGAAARVGLAPARSALAMEDGFSPCAQIFTVPKVERSSPWLAQLLRAYRASAVKSFILRRFEDSVRRAW